MALLGTAPLPVSAFNTESHGALVDSAIIRLPGEMRDALAPHEAFLRRGIADALAANTEARSTERVRAAIEQVERLGALDGSATPFLAYSLGALSVEVAHIAQPYGVTGPNEPSYAATYEALLDARAADRVAPRPLSAVPPNMTALLEGVWETAAARRAFVRADAENDFPPQSVSVTTAGMVVNAAVDAIAQVFRYVLSASPDAEAGAAYRIPMRLAQIRYGAHERVWVDVDQGLTHLAADGYRIPLSQENVGAEFFTMHRRGADCALYRLALKVHPGNARVRDALTGCAAAPPQAEAVAPNPIAPASELSSADDSGIRAFRHRRGHVLLTNRPDAVGEDFIPLNFEPIRPFAPAVAPTPTFDLEAVVEFYAQEYGLTSALVKAVIQTESDFDPHVVSRAGARGLMQLMPNTALEMGVEDIFDPVQNIAGGTQYLAKMLELFDNDLPLALAAYNAGPGTVIRYEGIPPYDETQRYVPLVLARQKTFARSGARVHLRGETPRPDVTYLPEPATSEQGAVVFLRNGLTMRGLQAVEIEGGVRLEMETGWILVPQHNVERVVRAAG